MKMIYSFMNLWGPIVDMQGVAEGQNKDDSD